MAALALPMGGCGQITVFDDIMETVSPYVTAVARLSGPAPRGNAVVVMKLGLGIPYCRHHAASIAVRDGKFFRTVARARSLEGVGPRHAGLMTARLAPGTYYIVHGRCRTGNRVYDVGRPKGRFSVWPARLRSSYATFKIGKGQVLNAGFLRFFPRAKGGRPRIKLQAMPRTDLALFKARRPKLRARLTSRLMRLTRPDGRALAARRGKGGASRKPRRKRRAVRPPPVSRPAPEHREDSPEPAAVMPPPVRKPRQAPLVKPPAAKTPVSKTPVSKTPVSKTPASKTPVSKVPIVKPKSLTSETSITAGQRRAACEALRELKREGKVKQLPVTCLQLKLPRPGLPATNGPDK